ncbi:MAG: hypothetical protein JRN39_07630 [Nitrososphaerota archaeon]|nr:hypothetical protein [Nitrososphaerota archaeon]
MQKLAAASIMMLVALAVLSAVVVYANPFSSQQLNGSKAGSPTGLSGQGSGLLTTAPPPRTSGGDDGGSGG